MSNKTLLFFTSSFPFGKDEAFIEGEFRFLSEKFMKVIIITNSPLLSTHRAISANCEILHFPYGLTFLQKILVLPFIDASVIYDEVKRRRTYDLPLKFILQSCFSTVAKSMNTEEFIKKVIEERQLKFSDVVLYSYWLNDIAVGLARLKCKHPSAKVVSRAHGWDVYFERHKPPYLPLRHYLFENLNRCFAISTDGANYMKKFTSNDSVISVSRLGTKKPISAEKEVLSKFHLVSCSSVISLKRIELIIEALALLKRTEIHWTHFGGGELLENNVSLANQMLVADGISFSFTGAIFNEELHKYYSKHHIDLFVNVSKFEGVPVSIMEAMSYSIPVLATNVGGVNEIVKEGFNGTLLPANPNAPQVADAILKHLEMNEADAQKYRQNAFEFWNENYNAEKNYSAFVNELLNL